MKSVIAWFVDNKVAANLLMFLMVIGGLITFPTLYREEFPNMDLGIVNVEVVYPMATAEEIESSICIKVEEAITGTVGIKKIRSTSVEGVCTVSSELEDSADRASVIRDIQNSVDRLDSLPEDAEQPIVSEQKQILAAIQLVISGDTDELSLKRIGERMRDEITDLPEVSQVQLLYGRPDEISLEISELSLRRHGLSLEQVANSIRANSIDLPGGMVKTDEGHVLLRTKTEAHGQSEFADIVVLAKPDGTQVHLGDIATVVDGFEDKEVYAKFDQRQSVIVDIRRVGEEDILNIASAVKAYIKTTEVWMPEGISISVWQDQSTDLLGRLQALSDNAISGLLLVLLVLVLFMRMSLAFWVAAGIPIALLGAVFFFPAFDISISTMSVVAIILVLGIVVDDAVVVGERIYAYQQLGASRRDAAIAGTREVSTPVIFGVLTTIATFVPLLMIPGPMGSFVAPIGSVAILALVFSLVESHLVLPAHLASHAVHNDNPSKITRAHQSVESRVSGFLAWFVENRYRPFLIRCIEWRYTTVSVAFGILIITVGMVAGGRIAIQFFPPVAGDRIYASVTLPQGTSVQETERAIAQMEQAVEQLTVEVDAERESSETESRVGHLMVSLGKRISKGSTDDIGDVGGHFLNMALELKLPDENEGMDINQIAARWRELTGAVPNAVQQNFDAAAVDMGNAIELQLKGDNLDELQAAASEVKAFLYGTAGVFDISDSFQEGKQELLLTLLPQARTLGLTSKDLANQVRQAFYGEEVQRIQRGKDEVKVFVRYPEDERRSIGNLEQMRIRTSSGVEVPFSSVALVTAQRGISKIERIDGHKVVSVIADVDRASVTPEAVLAKLQSKVFGEVMAAHPGVTISLGGEAESRNESVSSLILTCAISMFAVYALLAIPLKSYLQPMVVMSVVPFGTIGALWMHVLLNEDFMFFSILGVVALSGVVVNASLVLVDKTNRLRIEGETLQEALVDAACERFKPILLTSTTTFIGLLPLMTSDEWATMLFVPLSISLGGGVLVSTFISLLLVPALYRIVEDRHEAGEWFKAKLSRRQKLVSSELLSSETVSPEATSV